MLIGENHKQKNGIPSKKDEKPKKPSYIFDPVGSKFIHNLSCGCTLITYGQETSAELKRHRFNCHKKGELVGGK